MRKCFVLFCVLGCLLIVGLGCASVKKSIDYYEACRNDDSCYAQMVSNGNISKAVVTQVSEAIKFDDFLVQVAFNLVSALTGVFLGRKLKRC